jgi:hypothetical protein
MSPFRRAIIGIGEFCALLLVVCLTAGGAGLGYLMSIMAKNTTGFTAAIGNVQADIAVGAALGFVISASLAAMLFALAAIAKNTSERWFQ